MVYPPEDGHPSITNRTRRGLSSFLRWTPLTTTPCRQLWLIQSWQARAWFRPTPTSRQPSWNHHTRSQQSASSWRTTRWVSASECFTSGWSSWIVNCTASRRFTATSASRRLQTRSPRRDWKTTWNEVSHVLLLFTYCRFLVNDIGWLFLTKGWQCSSPFLRPEARFTECLTTVLRLLQYNAKVTMSLWRISNLQNILWRT